VLVRVLGGALVIWAGWASGCLVAGLLRRRPAELRNLQAGLELLDSEIWHGCTPLPEALRRAGQAVPPPVNLVLAETARLLDEGVSALEAWRGGVDAFFASSACDDEDREVLLSLGHALGRTCREDQRRHLVLVRERLAARERQAAALRDRYERLWSYLGVLAGAGLVLIFL